MIWRAADNSELFREFAAYVIRNSAIDFHPHKIADLLDEIELQRECGGPWTVFELDSVEAEAADFDDADLLSCFADVPPDEVCRDVPVDSVIVGRRSTWPGIMSSEFSEFRNLSILKSASKHSLRDPNGQNPIP